MKLSTTEFRAMRSLPRKLGQWFFEMPIFHQMGLELQNKDVLGIGCGPGYGAFLLNQLQPKSNIGLDVMNKQVELARKNYPKFKFLIQDAEDLSQFVNESKDVRRASPHSWLAQSNWRNIARVVYRMLKYQVEYEKIDVEEYEKKYKEQQTCAEPVEASNTWKRLVLSLSK